jgi:preprotein translocase subunit YajC
VLLAEDPANGGGGSPLLTFLPIILIIVAMYFLLIRPNSRRRREQAELQASLAPGDEVRTVGGLYGTIVASDAESVTIEAAPGVELRFARGAVASVTNKTASEPEEDTSVEDEYSDDEQSDPDDQAGPKKKTDRD